MSKSILQNLKKMWSKATGNFFEKAFGFRESEYRIAQQVFLECENVTKDVLDDRDVVVFHLPKGVVWIAGTFYTPSLEELRNETMRQLKSHATNKSKSDTGIMRVEHVASDVMEVHRTCPPWSTIQAASQFNCLEMISPHITPEAGVTNYEFDRTQGPQCAIAAPAGTVYRNYLAYEVPGGRRGQSSSWQVNTFSDVAEKIDKELGKHRDLSGSSAFRMQNGYLDVRSAVLLELVDSVVDRFRDDLESTLRIGVQRDTEVKLDDSPKLITQTYNSAIGIGYSSLHDSRHWDALARVVLRSSYEATMLIGLQNALRCRARDVPVGPIYLTFVGGGVFQNQKSWICEAINASFDRVEPLVQQAGVELTVRVVHYRSIDDSIAQCIPERNPVRSEVSPEARDL